MACFGDDDPLLPATPRGPLWTWWAVPLCVIAAVAGAIIGAVTYGRVG